MVESSASSVCSSDEFELEEPDDGAPDDGRYGSEELGELECAICADALWEPVRVPSCKHAFCRSCLLELVRRTEGNQGARCPLCRAQLPAREAAEGENATPRWLIDAEPDAHLVQRLHTCLPPAMLQRRRTDAELRSANVLRLRVHEASTLDRPGNDPIRTIAVEVEPPVGCGLAPDGTGQRLSDILIDEVHFEMPRAHVSASALSTTSTASEVFTHEDAIVQLTACSPFELTLDAARSGRTELPVRVRVLFKARLRLPELVVVHTVHVAGQPDEREARVCEVPLPNGLTWGRLLERTRPKARVGVGSSQQRNVYG